MRLGWRRCQRRGAKTRWIGDQLGKPVCAVGRRSVLQNRAGGPDPAKGE